MKTSLGVQRYNNRIDKIWENARRIERERVARGEKPNPNLTNTCKACGAPEKITDLGGVRLLSLTPYSQLCKSCVETELDEADDTSVFSQGQQPKNFRPSRI